MAFYGEFPAVVELNVGGVKCTALLSTLRKDEDSLLAAMFSGREPVYQDKEGRFYLDTNGTFFKIILEYLQMNTLPFQCTIRSSPSFGSPCQYPLTDDTVAAIYSIAKQFKLKTVIERLECHASIVLERKIEEFQKSRRGYSETMDKILSALTPDVLLSQTSIYIQLCEEFAAVTEKCCDHVCSPYVAEYGFGFGARRTYTPVYVDGVIKVPFTVDIPFLNCLCMDLTKFGFSAQVLLAECKYKCDKQSGQRPFLFGGFGGHKQNYCCKTEVCLIKFDMWDRISKALNPFGTTGLFGRSPTPVFGTPKPAGGLFGGQQPNQGFGFGAVSSADDVGQAEQQPKGKTPTLFSSASGFGSANQQDQSSGAFGAASNSSGFSFGSAQTSQQQQGHGGCFGSAQPSQSSGGLFGSASSQQPNHSSSFGTSFSQMQNQPSGFGTAFGQQKNQSNTQQQHQTLAFGAPSASPFGSFGQPQQSSGGLFGSASSSTGFGSSTTQQQTNSSFGRKPGGFSFGGASQESTTSIGLFNVPRTPAAPDSPTEAPKAKVPNVTAASTFSFGGRPVLNATKSNARPFDSQQTQSSMFFHGNKSGFGANSASTQPVHKFGSVQIGDFKLSQDQTNTNVETKKKGPFTFSPTQSGEQPTEREVAEGTASADEAAANSRATLEDSQEMACQSNLKNLNISDGGEPGFGLKCQKFNKPSP